MFSNFGFGEIAVLALLGLLIFGPDKLPKAAADAFRLVRQLRSMATSTVNDFKADLGPDLADLDLRSMHPRTLIERALRDDEPAQQTHRPDPDPAHQTHRPDPDPTVSEPATALDDIRR
jgi:sec-independent protein translocase protein TatB